MTLLTLNYSPSSALLDEDILASMAELSKIREIIMKERNDILYQHNEAFAYAPYDRKAREEISRLAHVKREKNIHALVLVGIGGSNLGVLAVYNALCGDKPSDSIPALYNADTLDDVKLAQMLDEVEQLLVSGKNILVTVISKSGTTLETLVNASFFIKLLKKYKTEDYSNYLVYITDEHSPLWQKACDFGIDCLSIPAKVGGRYSVFTAVGLFPLAILGIDIEEFCLGAQMADSNDAALVASTFFGHYSNGLSILDIFVFSPRLATLGGWFRQLVGESLGKRVDLDGNEARAGLVPTVSVGTTDLHSVGQLYLAGPRRSFTNFVTIHQERYSHHVESCDELPLTQQSIGRPIAALKNAIFEGLTYAYAHEQLPFITQNLETVSPQSLGAFMFGKMIEIVMLGHLMRVNPFDQPEVELYKNEARSILEKL